MDTPKHRTVSIAFSAQDKELIAWANMLEKDGQKPRTWVQAVLLAETVGIDIDIGSVYVPRKKPVSSSARPMFGDDTPGTRAAPKVKPGWGVRGKNGEYIPGSILVVKVTRKPVIDALDSVSCRKKGPYLKAIIRKHLKILPSGSSQPPDPSQIQDMFVLYENFFSGHKKEEPPCPVKTKPAEESRPSLKTKQTPENRPVTENREVMEKEPAAESSLKDTVRQNHFCQKEDTVLPEPPAVPKIPQNPLKDSVSVKKKNPLLGYIQ